MKDFIGQELEVGDWVAFITPGYRDLTLGQISKFTPKNMRVSFTTNGGRFKDSKLVDPNTAIKIDGPTLTVMLLKKK